MPEATTRKIILQALKKRGELRVEDLAELLEVTPSAVRQQLNGLMADGLVGFREQKGGPGRPRHLYRLTDAAESLFPKMYSELTNELLDYIGDSDPRLVDELFERRRQRRVEGARSRLAGRPFAERVEVLASILDEDGYLADFERRDDGSWRIVEHNCAILGVATRYGQACSSEIGFLREAMPDAVIERISHMIAGAHMCAYEVRPKAEGASRFRESGGPHLRSVPDSRETRS
jgi:DeoR family transcriptional regulator, suf operon transcriptional repressor